MFESDNSQQGRVNPHLRFPSAFKKFPSKIQVEVTTRCNMNCSMCVKYASESKIIEQDLSLEKFKKLDSAFEQCETLVLNGIGEPLLHPDLAEMAAYARARMPEHGSIGFQTNGLLFTEKRAQGIVSAGVDTFCISVDSLSSESGDGELHGQSSIDRLVRTISLLKESGRKFGNKIRIGVEFVLMADTYKQLPDVVSWAAEQGVEFVICSHVLAHDPAMQEQSLFNPNTPKASALFDKWKIKAQEQGIDLSQYFKVVWGYERIGSRDKYFDLIKEIRADAQAQDVWVHLRSLMEWDGRNKTDLHRSVRETCAETRNLAEQLGIELRMPQLMATDELHCRFIEEGTAFITSQGDVSPCQFLWHEYNCYMDGSEKLVKSKVFGNLAEKDFGEIWRSAHYTEFRSEVLEYEYPYCSNCPMVPCDDIIGRSYDFEFDCFGIEVPCGHCPWAMGGLQCLL